jgi:hypothetical protein
LFLVSDGSGFITDLDAAVDGGVSLGQDRETHTAPRSEIGQQLSPTARA